MSGGVGVCVGGGAEADLAMVQRVSGCGCAQQMAQGAVAALGRGGVLAGS